MATYNPETWAMSPAERVKETRRMYVARGLCPYCYGARPAEPGREACRACALERNRRYNERRRKRLEAGICGKCGKQRDTDTQYCSACRDRCNADHREGKRRYRERGLCLHCGFPALPGRAHCPDCAKMYHQTNTARYRAMQERRPTCPHEVWHTSIRVLGVQDGRVKLRWRDTCRLCRKAKQSTFLADPARFEKFIGWHGVTPTGELQHAA